MEDGQENFRKLSRRRNDSIVGELWRFMKQNKKFWLLPILITIAIVGVLIVLAGSAAAPFIYPLF
jgi:hypothetical protein